VKHYQIKLYHSDDFALWNTFISVSKNATFLFHRDFMEYHADRFEDFSLLVFDETKLVAVLPANRVGGTVYSHQGLTYGGLVLNKKAKLSEVLGMFKSVLFFLNQNQIETLSIKMMPSIYTTNFSDELIYCLFAANAILTQCDALSVIDLSKPFEFSDGRKEGIKRGIKNNLVVKETTNVQPFWGEILIPNLEHKHQAKPVHTGKEMQFLQQKFPENIRIFNVYHNDKIVAGTVVFVTEKVVHAQYISGNEQKNELGSVDFLHDFLLKNVFQSKDYFDFGISNEAKGRKINTGLLFWKESFGAKTVTQTFYEVPTVHHTLLESIEQ